MKVSVRSSPGSPSITAPPEIANPGVKSSFTSVPVAVARAIGAPAALLSTTRKLSSASSTESPRIDTATVLESSPGANVTLPDAASVILPHERRPVRRRPIHRHRRVRR